MITGIAGRGKSINNLIEFQPDEQVTSVMAVKDFSENRYIVMLSTAGLIKKTKLDEFKNIRRGGIIAIPCNKSKLSIKPFLRFTLSPRHCFLVSTSRYSPSFSSFFLGNRGGRHSRVITTLAKINTEAKEKERIYSPVVS